MFNVDVVDLVDGFYGRVYTTVAGRGVVVWSTKRGYKTKEKALAVATKAATEGLRKAFA